MIRKMLLGTACALALTVVAPVCISPVAQAQPLGAVGKAGVVTVQARVQSVDPQQRLVTLVGPEGRTLTVRAGDQVRNFAQIRPGDLVTVQYYESVGYVLSAPNTRLPSRSERFAGTRAPEGAKPAGVVARRVTLTGIVTGVDAQQNLLSVVDEHGGAVRTVHVTDPEYQARLGNVHVGDKLSVVLTQALAISLTPAGPM